MSRVLLVNPPYTEKVYSGLKNAVAVTIPLGLAYIGAVMKKEGIYAEALDANVLELSVEETSRRIAKSSCNIIFFTSTSSTITTIYKICRNIKSDGDKTVIVGGPHATFTAEQTLKECRDIDIIARGEGEFTSLELAKGNCKGLDKIDGITYRKNGRIVHNKDRKRIENLDELPFPARELFPTRLYRPGAIFNTWRKNSECETIITARGCPNRCKYCSSVHFWGTQVKFRSAMNIIKEIEFLQKKYNTRQIAIIDDTFTAHIPRLEEFCRLIKERKIRIEWWCWSRINIPKRILRLMKGAGCYGLNFGIESGNEDILKRINKNITKEDTLEVISEAKRLGFLVNTSFMIGLPGDTKETVMQTIRWAIKLNPHIAFFCITTPFPGTELYSEALEKGWMEEVKNWDDIGLHMKTKYHNENLSSEEIYWLYKLAQHKFYFRLGFFWQIFKHLLKNPRQIKGFVLLGLYMLTE